MHSNNPANEERTGMNFEQWRHSTRAWLFHFIGKEELAYEEYVIAYRHNPSAGAARSLGCIKAGKEATADAIYWFEEAVRLEPEHAETWFNLGFVRERDGRRQEAIDAFRETVRLKPTIDRAWYGMGMAYAALGEHQQAVTAFEEAARLQPMNSEARYQLGMACYHAGDPKRTRAAIKELKGFDPKRANALIRDTGSHEFDDLVTTLPF